MAKAARKRSLFTCLLCLAIGSGWAQQVTRATQFGAESIILSGNRLLLGDVLQSLEKQAGVHFVYSSNKVAAQTPITLTARRRSLDEILGQLSEQTDLYFRRRGKYVVIKPNPAPTNTVSQDATLVKPSFHPQENPVEDSALKYADATLQTDPYRFDRDEVHREIVLKDLPNATQNLVTYDTSFNYKYQQAVSHIKHKIRVARPWFASLGLYANDFYISDMEANIGHQYFYGVVNVGIEKDLSYHLNYGAGTSFRISRKISIYPIYTYSHERSLTDYNVIGNSGNVIEVVKKAYQETTRHQQVRLVAHWNILYGLDVQAGITYNMVSSDYRLVLPERQLRQLKKGHGGSVRYQPRPPEIPADPAGNNSMMGNTTLPQRYHADDAWVGFEVGVSYRLHLIKIR